MISYGKSNTSFEVMILNDSEIFHKRKIGKRSLTNICTISWNCKNKSNCNAALLSCRDNHNTDGSDYNVTRVLNRGHTELCTINRTDVIVLKHLNYLMEQCEEPRVNQQIAYEGVFNEFVIHSPIASRSFPAYNALRSAMSRFSFKNRPSDPTVETIETFDIPINYQLT